MSIVLISSEFERLPRKLIIEKLFFVSIRTVTCIPSCSAEKKAFVFSYEPEKLNAANIDLIYQEKTIDIYCIDLFIYRLLFTIVIGMKTDENVNESFNI